MPQIETHTKRIRDPLYGFIDVDEEDRALLDHPLVQRLRWVSQLPLEQLVYPSAQHSRFEHSLGVFHLARQAAQALFENAPEEFDEAAKTSDRFRDLTAAEQRERFRQIAGWCGLLHDIGHAPFSHTFEDACEFAIKPPVAYNHERFGLCLAKIVLESAVEERWQPVIVRVLDKSTKQEDLWPLESLLRALIDGPIDVDKGDYLLRDGYHCGVAYGNYDWRFLWNNVTIKNGILCVRAKAALEAWSLRIGRYKMHSYVYKHHVRNITDAMLVDILIAAFDRISVDDTHNIRDIAPLQSDSDARISLYEVKFRHWTDDGLLKSLSEIPNADEILSQIEAFSARKLFKERFRVSLDDSPHYHEDPAELLRRIRNLRKEDGRFGSDWNCMPVKLAPVPVLEAAVQSNIHVLGPAQEPTPLAKYLGFSVGEDEIIEEGSSELCVYAATSAGLDEDALKTRIREILNDG